MKKNNQTKNWTKKIGVYIFSSLLFNCLLKLKMYNCATKMTICEVCVARQVYDISASNTGTNGHERSKCATTLNHYFSHIID